ncbi:MAG: class I SAM-dependent methyltransferase [Rubrobacteraceae bacterium]
MSIKDTFKNLLWGQLGRPSGLNGRIVGRLMTASNIPAHDLTLSNVRLEPGDRVLEVGFGGGALIEKLLDTSPGVTVCGIDASGVMVRQARARNLDAVRRKDAELLLGDVSSLPYSDASFEKVVSVHSIYFWPDPISNLREISRVLVPGGYFVLTIDYTEPMKDPTAGEIGHTTWSRAALLTVLAEAGFSDVGSEVREDSLVCAWGGKPV